MKTCQISVQLDNVKKVFGDKVALDIDSFKIEAGDIRKRNQKYGINFVQLGN